MLDSPSAPVAPVSNLVQGLTLLSGQSYILNNWYAEPRPQLGWVAVGRRGGTTTLASLLVLQDAVQFVQNWPAGTANHPYFVLLVPSSDQVAYVMPQLKMFTRNVVLHSNGVSSTYEERKVTSLSLEYEAARDCITLWTVEQPRCKVRILVKGATDHVLRGCDARTVVMDTLCAYRDPEAVYANAVPLLTNPKNRVLALSTPHPDPKNFFNRKWHQAQNKPNNWTASIPTWEMNPALGSYSQIAQEMTTEHFHQEFGAVVPTYKA